MVSLDYDKAQLRDRLMQMSKVLGAKISGQKGERVPSQTGLVEKDQHKMFLGYG